MISHVFSPLLQYFAHFSLQFSFFKKNLLEILLYILDTNLLSNITSLFLHFICFFMSQGMILI